MSAWKENLSESTGQWAFVLTLSKRQIDALEYLRDGNRMLGAHHTHWFNIEKALERRGLILNIREPDPCDRFPDRMRRHLELSPAGRIVCDLLVMAGAMSKPRVRLAGVGGVK